MKSLKTYVVAGIIFVSVLGTLFYFAYDFTGENALVGLFTPVNESIWEHAKLIFFPMLIYSFYLNKTVKTQYPCISSAMILGSLVGVTLIITLYYTYSGILGFNLAPVDILIFYLSTVISFFIVYKTARSCKAEKHHTLLQILQMLLLCLFFIFTSFPPNIALFIEP